MSYSSLFVVDGDCNVSCVKEFGNSWLFSPPIWDVITQSCLPESELVLSYSPPLVYSIIGAGVKIWPKVNGAMNESSDMVTRTIWELTQQQVFYGKDIKYVVDCIDKFIDKYKSFCNILTGETLLHENVINRAVEIRNVIDELPNTTKYFVLKNTSVDDSISSWFSYYDSELDEHYDICNFDECMEHLIEEGNYKDAQFVKFNDDRTDMDFVFADQYKD